MGCDIQYLVGSVMIRRVLLFVATILPLPIMADFPEVEPNVKYGKLTEDQTWEGDIYLVGDVLVPKDVKLIISPGTRLFFSEYDVLRSGKDSEQTELLVDGELTVNSNEENPVLVSTIGDAHWKQLSAGDRSVKIEFKPYQIDTEPMRQEFHQFKKQYIVLWTLIYAMWILAI